MKQRLPLFALGVFALLTMAFSLYQLGRLSARHDFAGTVIQNPPVVSDLRLVDENGEERTLASWPDKNLLVFFGFTNCPDVCPLTMAYLADLYEDLGEPGGLQVVMITVDPERDTPEVLGSYVKGFHPHFVGLTGDAEMIAEATSRFFIGHRHVHDGMIMHTDIVALVDPEGKMRYIYNQVKLDELEHDLRYVLAQQRW
jgi:protein SCO1